MAFDYSEFILNNPGVGGYSTLGPLFNPGYQVLFKTFLNHPKDQPDFPRAFADPRGVLPDGMLPANNFSYEILEQTTDFVNVQRISATAVGVTVGQVVGQTTVGTWTKNCVIGFEGHDVIDLPTKDLPVGNGIVCPTSVFFPIYAGGKFINSKDDSFATKSALEYERRSKNNGVKGIVSNDDLPLDSIQNENGLFGGIARNGNIYGVDATSNTIDGSGQYVSYVAIDKPVFRDVITSYSAAIAQGFFFGEDLYATSLFPYSETVSYLIRYAMINVGTEISPKYRWRMTESYGIEPDKKVGPPNEVYAINANATNLASFSSHYAYDVNETGDEITKDFKKSTPLKTGYNPQHALLMMDSGSSLYRPNVKFSIQKNKTGSIYNKSNFDIKSIYPRVANSGSLQGIVQQRSITSDVLEGQFSSNFRVGLEYSMHYVTGALQSFNSAILLTSTKPASTGISSYYDHSINAIVVHAIEFGTITERIIYDYSWKNGLPFSNIDSFLLGENNPYKTGGKQCFYSLNETKVVKAGEKIPSDFSPIEVFISQSETKDDSLLSFGSENNYSFEISVPFKADGISVSIPPIDVSIYKESGGIKLRSINTCSKKDFLLSLENIIESNDDKKDKEIYRQLKENKNVNVPLVCSGISTGTLNHQTVFAYSSFDSINIAFRKTLIHPSLIIRDIVFRGEKKSQSIATDPIIICNSETKTINVFYIYKKRILCKTMAYVIFESIDLAGFENGRLLPQIEADVACSIQKITSCISYDGHAKNKRKDIEYDIDNGYIRIDETEKDIGNQEESVSILSYSVCKTTKYILLLISEKNRITIKRSTDEGDTWNYLWESDVRIIKSNGNDKDDPEGEFPYCFSDGDSLMFFLFMDSALLSFTIPENSFYDNLDQIKILLKNIDIKIIYGELSENLKNKGIILSKAVIERQKENSNNNKEREKETINPQKITVCKNGIGCHRLFFYDAKQLIKSLISMDNGNTWLTENQYKKQL